MSGIGLMTDAELAATAASIAYESCCSVIDVWCLDVSEEAGAEGWFQLPSDIAIVEDDIRYLEARGLLERHETREDWISVRD